jgi:MFS family permease
MAALLIASTVSITGDSFTRLAAPWFVLATTGSAAKTGLAAFAATLPSVLSAAVGGPLVDRLGLRRSSVLTDIGCSLAIGLVPTLYLAHALSFPALLVAIACASLLHSPGDTAREVLVPPLARTAGITLTRAAGMVDGANRTARMAGFSLAGALVALLGATPVLYLDAASFAVSATLIGLLVPAGLSDVSRPPAAPAAAGAAGAAEQAPGETAVGQAAASQTASQAAVGGKNRCPPRYLVDLSDGLRFLWRTRVLRAVSLMVLVTNGLDQAYTAVLLPVFERTQGHGASSVGLILGATSLGQVVGAFGFSAIGHHLPRKTAYTIAFMLIGAPKFLLITAGLPLWTLATVLSLLATPAGMLNPLLATLLYDRVPAALRTRVFGAFTASVLAAIPLGGLAAGYVAGALHGRWPLWLFGFCYLLTTLAPLVVPAFRDMRTQERGPAEALARSTPASATTS